MTNMGAFWTCHCFLQGLFTAWGMKQGLIVSHGNITKLCLCRFVLCGYVVMWPSVMCDECSIPIGHPLCVKFIPNLEGVVRSCDLACALAIPWCWVSLACSTAFTFELALIRLLIWFSLSQRLPNQLCHLPFLILLKSSHHILLRLFAHWLIILILTPMSFVQLFVLPTLKLSSLKHRIQDVQSFQHHVLPWKKLSNLFLKQIIIILVTNFVFLLLSTLKLSATIPLTCTTSVVGYVSNKQTPLLLCVAERILWGRVSCCAAYDL